MKEVNVIEYTIEKTKIGTIYVTETRENLGILTRVDYIFRNENGQELTEDDLWAHEDPFKDNPILISSLEDYRKANKMYYEVNGKIGHRKFEYYGERVFSLELSPLELFGWSILTEESTWGKDYKEKKRGVM